jgi:F-type H+-transporting ATPase subunit b
MLIDWFTVAAQLLNFLILVGLLSHFLYKPIRNAIDTREKRIAAELADADKKKAEADREHADFQNRNKVFDEQRAAMLAKVVAEAAVQRERLLNEAHQAADDYSERQASSLRNDRIRLSGEIARLVKTEVFAIARKTLGDLATVSLEERIGEVFTRRLREMDAKAKRALGAALETSSEPALVRSTFCMPLEQRSAVQNALNETFSAVIRVRFETAPDSISGIEIVVGGQKLAWSIDDYLNALEQKLGLLLNAPPQTEAKFAPKAEVKPAPKLVPVPVETDAHATVA